MTQISISLMKAGSPEPWSSLDGQGGPPEGGEAGPMSVSRARGEGGKGTAVKQRHGRGRFR